MVAKSLEEEVKGGSRTSEKHDQKCCCQIM